MTLPPGIRGPCARWRRPCRRSAETPRAPIEARRVEANLRRAQDRLAGLDLRVRPHVEAHEPPAVDRRARRLGACGLTVRKMGAAEVMADAGPGDILPPHDIRGAGRRSRRGSRRG